MHPGILEKLQKVGVRNGIIGEKKGNKNWLY